MKNKGTAVITGAANGIGQAYAKSLAANGFDSVVANFVDLAATKVPPVTALVNNAVIYPWKSFEDTGYNTWRKVMNVNLDEAFLICKTFVIVMTRRSYGSILNVVSTTCWLKLQQITAYIASKGDIINFIRALASVIGTLYSN